MIIYSGLMNKNKKCLLRFVLRYVNVTFIKTFAEDCVGSAKWSFSSCSEPASSGGKNIGFYHF